MACRPSQRPAALNASRQTAAGWRWTGVKRPVSTGTSYAHHLGMPSATGDGEEQLDAVGLAGGARQLVRLEGLPVEEHLLGRANPALAVEQHLPQRLILARQLDERRLDGGGIHADDPLVVGEAQERA